LGSSEGAKDKLLHASASGIRSFSEESLGHQAACQCLFDGQFNLFWRRSRFRCIEDGASGRRESNPVSLNHV
jgi:hypothetical protein